MDDENERQGSQTIGDLLPSILKKAEARVTPPTKSNGLPAASENTPRQPVEPNGTGTPPLERGSAVALPARTLPPDEATAVDRSLEAGLPLCGRSLRWQSRAIPGLITETPQHWSAAPMLKEGATREDAQAATQRVWDSLAGASPMQIGKELSRLRYRTKMRSEGDADTEGQIAVYLEDLQKYPVDVVRVVLRGWVDGPPEIAKWFPAWAELREELDRRIARRKLMLRCLIAVTEGET